MPLPKEIEPPEPREETELRRRRYERWIAEGHRAVLEEIETQRRLGLIDEDGNLLEPAKHSGGRGGDPGGWG
jgi:hypothetical protein